MPGPHRIADGRRHNRAITLASLPVVCAVCQGDENTGVQRPDRNVCAGRMPCAHCVLGLPIAHLPMRDDSPRTGSTA